MLLLRRIVAARIRRFAGAFAAVVFFAAAGGFVIGTSPAGRAAEEADFVYRKIVCPEAGCVEEDIRANGAEVVVRDARYLVVYLPRDVSLPGYELLPVGDADLVMRMAVVEIASRFDADFIAAIGADILEAGEDYLLIRVFDGQVDKIEEAGYVIEFIPRP
jgi:hypothetical protein